MRHLACNLVHYAPDMLKRYFINRQDKLQEHARETVATNLTYNVSSNVLYMAYREAIEIDQLEHELIEPTLDRLVFYYSPQDQYTPPQQVQEFRERFPQGTWMYDRDWLADLLTQLLTRESRVKLQRTCTLLPSIRYMHSVCLPSNRSRSQRK